MEFLVILSFALGTMAAAVIAPRQPREPAHTVALAGHDGTDSSEILLWSDPNAETPASIPSSPAAAANNDIANAIAGTPTTTAKIPVVTQKTRPKDPEPIIVLPFHFQVIENCLSDNTIQARGVYVNRDFVWAYTLADGTTVAVNHGIRGYPHTFLIGPFDYGSSTLHFSYDNDAWKCDWKDAETWKECGECRSALWNAPPLDCNGGGDRTRTKHMDCSFIMGYTSQLRMKPL